MKILEKLKTKWGIPSTLDVFLILVVFSLAGSSVVYARKFIMGLIGLDSHHPVIYTIVYIILIFPLYQTFLLLYGFFLGQFGFFWEKEKKMGKWFVNIFKKKSDFNH